MIKIDSKWTSIEEYCKHLTRFLDKSVSIYHRQPWLKAISNGFGVEVSGMISTDHNGTLLAVTPFIILKKGPFRLMGSPLSGMYTEFAGPVFMDGLCQLDQTAVLKSQHELAMLSGHYIEWGVKSDGNELNINTLLQLGYSYIMRPTLLINLSIGKENVWSAFQGRARNMVRKSEKSGVVARTVKPTRLWIDAYYEILQETFRRQGRAPPHPLSFYHQITQIAVTEEVLCVSCEIDGCIITGGIFLIDRKRMLYLSGASNPMGMKLAASSLLQWHAVCEAISIGVNEYDMGGLGVPSIDKFKRSFGGHEIFHHRWVYRTRLFSLIEPIALWATEKGLISIGARATQKKA
jgi:hypothetical protein